MYNNIILLFIVFFPIGIPAQTINYKTEKAIFYYDTKEANFSDYQKERCLLDVYYPETIKKAPVIVWFHGGGLTSGTREIPEELKNNGYLIVGVGYRLSPKVRAEQCIVDAVAALAWVFKNIEKFNGDSNAIFVSGHSAGGYLALMSVLDKNRLKKFNIDANNVAGLVPFSGHTITHFTIREEQGIPGEQPIIDTHAPLYFVRGDAPSTLLITGDRELEMLGRYEENAYFYRMMKVSGQKEISLIELQGYDHNMTKPAFPLLLNFISEKTIINVEQ
tara:strand:- start:18063 stop:18890 length:828 start_codon:yes stop_codon:yes gene_type:complete